MSCIQHFLSGGIRRPEYEPLASVLAGLCLLAWALAPGVARADSSNRLYLAAQNDFGAKSGFYVDFENSAKGDARCSLDTLNLILGVADGKQWRFIRTQPAWQADHLYTVRAIVGPDKDELWLDGKQVGASPGVYQPFLSQLTADSIPGWADGPADYFISQESLQITSGDATSLNLTFPKEAPRAPALWLFAVAPGRTMEWKAPQAGGMTITATFEIHALPNPKDVAPIVDRYGQCRYATWPGKIATGAQLKAVAGEEARRLKQWGPPPHVDKYGGDTLLPAIGKPTGFYHLAQQNGVWWLVTPEAHRCFYVGLCSPPALTWPTTPVTGREYLFEWLPPRTGPFAGVWGHNAWGEAGNTNYVCLHMCNLIRKYGADWQKAEDALTVRRLKDWGFSGIAKWGGMDGVSSTPVLSRSGVPNLVRRPDVFDPAVQQQFRAALQRQIEPRRNDPTVVGWSLGNEYDEIITLDETRAILQKPAATPARKAMIEDALHTLYHDDAGKMAAAWKTQAGDADFTGAAPPAEDLEKLRQFYATAYYRFIYQTVKAIDPNHLYLGFWIVPGWWQNESDWGLIAPYCDAIGYDRYSPQFSDAMLSRLTRATGKPIFCGEFSFPPDYGGLRGFGEYGAANAPDEAHAGQDYAQWVADAARSPYCVGTCWFEYRDEPLLGRGPGSGPALTYGEHYAFGMVDVTDTPKWDLVTPVRKANLLATQERYQASQQR